MTGQTWFIRMSCNWNLSFGRGSTCDDGVSSASDERDGSVSLDVKGSLFSVRPVPPQTTTTMIIFVRGRTACENGWQLSKNEEAIAVPVCVDILVDVDIDTLVKTKFYSRSASALLRIAWAIGLRPGYGACRSPSGPAGRASGSETFHRSCRHSPSLPIISTGAGSGRGRYICRVYNARPTDCAAL
jgi:hypothetical protein